MGSQPADKGTAAFFVLGFVFIAIGASRHRGLAAVGIVFLVLALVRRSRRSR